MTACCTINGCDLPHEARGLCHKHYQRWWYQSRHPEMQQFVDGPPVCLCPTAAADGIGQCTICWHPVVSLHPGLTAALRHWPQLAHQTVTRQARAVA